VVSIAAETVKNQIKLSGGFADDLCMTTVARPKTEKLCLMFGVEGIELAPAVQPVDEGHASFESATHFDKFYEGQMIGPAVLSLKAEGMVVVYPVVKSRNWPMIYVEFMGLSEKDRLVISQFLSTCSGL
jgi:hypothetical protein